MSGYHDENEDVFLWIRCNGTMMFMSRGWADDQNDRTIVGNHIIAMYADFPVATKLSWTDRNRSCAHSSGGEYYGIPYGAL